MKIKFGALVTDGRGKIGGHVASKNRAGSYLRTKVTPVNPNTSFQAITRSRLTGFSQAWRSLTEAERLSWEGAVGSFARTDIFGDIKNPSGINLYVRLNMNLAEVVASGIDEPPLPASVVGPLTLSLTATAGTPSLSLEWTGGAVPADTRWIVRATPQLSAGKNFVKNLYRNVDVMVSTVTSPYDLLAVYNSRFGALIEGQKMFLEVVPVNTVTGQKGQATSVSVIVAA